MAVVKSRNDPHDYRVVHLENGLTALLISDMKNPRSPKASEGTDDEMDEDESSCSDEEGTDGEEDDEEQDEEEGVSDHLPKKKKAQKMAAAALCIGVGSFSDPDKIPGLAHFLEHMVFMGSEKFPDENDFDSFIKKHAGSNNASTDCERTVFQFDIRPKHFREALNRFAQFFISPLLKEDTMKREIQAVDSEFKMIFTSDTARKMHIVANMTKHGHPFSKFLWGNEETLLTIPKEKNIDVQSHLREFRERMYSAHYMTLAVLSNETLDFLEECVRESFTSVPNNGLPMPTFYSHVPAFDEDKFLKFYKVVPVKQMNQLVITWMLPCLLQHYRIKPSHYVSWLVGHEGPGSILALLKRRGWAISLTSGNDGSGSEFNTSFAEFSCGINLTEEGMNHIQEIITIVFQYIKMLQDIGPESRRIYQEQQIIAETTFRFQEQCDPVYYVEEVCENMQLYPEEDYLTGEELMWDFNEQVISEVQAQLTPDKANFILLSKKFADECSEKEKWFQTPYSVSDIDPQWKELWKDLDLNPELHIPEENKFIATDFSLKEADIPNSKNPVCIRECSLGRVWYMKDNQFKVPKAHYYFHLITPLVHTSPEYAVLTDIFLNVLDYNLKEIAYAADMAQLRYSLQVPETGIAIKLYGFNHKLRLLFETIIDQVANFTVSETAFNSVKYQLIKSYSNNIIKAHKLVRDIRLQILMHIKWSTVDKRAVIEDITIEKVKSFAEQFKSKLFIDTLIQGNVTSKEALSLQDYLYSKLGFMCLPRSSHPEVRVVELPHGEHVCRVTGFNKEDTNSVVTNYYQYGPADVNLFCKLELLLFMMEEPTFDILRTREQLGYSVFSTCRNTYGIAGFSVTVQTQAGKFSVDYVDTRIEAFLVEFAETLKNMTEEDFKAQVDSLVEMKEYPDLSISEEAERNWVEVLDQTVLFDRRFKEAEALKKIKKSDLEEFFTSLIPSGQKHRKLSSQIVGCGDCEPLAKAISCDTDSGHIEEDEVWALKPLHVEGAECIMDITSFKKNLLIYPVSKVK